MNTERPDNNDPGEAFGGGDGSAAEALGTSGASGAETLGAGGTGDAQRVRGSAAPGDGRTSGAGAPTAEESDAGADQDGAAGGTEEASRAAEDSAKRAEGVAAAGTDASRAPATAATADAAGPDRPANADTLADDDEPRAPADAGDSPAPDALSDHDEPRAPARAGLGKLTAPEAAADPDETVGLGADSDQPRPAADADSDDSQGSDLTAAAEPVNLGTDTDQPRPAAAAAAAEPDGPSAPGSTAAAEPVNLGTDTDRHGTSVGADSGPALAAAALPHPPAPHAEVPRDEEAGARRSALHRSPVAIAAVAAAVLLVGGGGAYLAAGASGGSGGGTASGASGDGTPPPLALDGYPRSGGADNGIAPGEPNPYGVTYRADGDLPAGPGSAAVHRAQGQVAKDDVVRLAEALGVDGTPVAQGQVWRIGVNDGSGPSLQVNRQAPGAWTFQRYSPTDDCQSETVCRDSEATTGTPVSEAVAEKAAAPVLKAVGQGDAKRDASQVMGAERIVNADPVVGALPTYGWATGVTVDARGEVVGGTGQLKAPVKSDTYPVLSAERTLGLLNDVSATDHRVGIGGCATPVPQKDRLEAPCGESTASPVNSTLTVEKAVFGLASQLVEGRQALVPSWLFEVRETGAKDAFTVTYPAVDPTYIASPATATPTSPAAPTAPSDEPTSAPKTRDVKVDGYTAEGDELTVSFTGGVCGDYAATASETSGEVKVTVTETPWPDKVCIMIAKEMQKTVPLDEPLGDRTVVGSDGKQIPLKKAGARLPETSGAR